MASITPYTIKSGKTRYLVRWVDGGGVRRTQRGFTSKRAAQEFGDDAQTRGRRVKHGLETPADQKRRQAAARPIAEHLGEYLTATQAQSSPRHVRQVRSSIEAMIKACGWTSIGEISADAAAKILAARHKAGVGPNTINHHRTYLRSFSAWLTRHGRLSADPLAGLNRYDARADVRRVRRPFTDGELKALLAAVDEPRRMLYTLMVWTGLRLGEVRSLTRASFQWEGDGAPLVVVLAAYSKRRRREEQPIPIEIARMLQPWVERQSARGPLWRIPHHAAEMLRADLKAAEIEHRDADGRVLDLHSLRHTYITRLVASRATVKEAQRLARHSTATLTIDRYAHVEQSAVRLALERSSSAPRLAAQESESVGQDQTGEAKSDDAEPPISPGNARENDKWAGEDSNLRRLKPSDLQSDSQDGASIVGAGGCAAEPDGRAPAALQSGAPMRGAERRHPACLPEAKRVVAEMGRKIKGLVEAEYGRPNHGGIEDTEGAPSGGSA